jgi:hypothetical protein
LFSTTLLPVACDFPVVLELHQTNVAGRQPKPVLITPPIILVIIIMVTTIRNNVGSNLYRPFALGQRLFSFHCLLDHGGCTWDGGGMEKNARGEKTGRYLTLKDTGERYKVVLMDEGHHLPDAHTPTFRMLSRRWRRSRANLIGIPSSSTPKRVPITFRM